MTQAPLAHRDLLAGAFRCEHIVVLSTRLGESDENGYVVPVAVTLLEHAWEMRVLVVAWRGKRQGVYGWDSKE